TQLQLDSERSKDLSTQTEQLALYRESNKTLRQEYQRCVEEIATARAEIDQLNGTVEPLKATLHEKTKENEVLQQNKKELEEDLKRWQGRVSELLEKYQQIDPEDHRTLQRRISELEAERDEARN